MEILDKIAITGFVLGVSGVLCIKFISDVFGDPHIIAQGVLVTITLGGIAALFIGGLLSVWF
jgi:hypothetical protein